MEARGYAGAFKRRNGAHKRDGCATFWRASALMLVADHALELDSVQAPPAPRGAPRPRAPGARVVCAAGQ
jgi:hypothetical protein